jgi:hypothetical protein
MVDIQSIAGSSRPSHHEQGTEQEATSHSRVGRSCRTNTRGVTTVVEATAAATHWQHPAATTVVLPPGAGPEAMLEAARQVLHNPPGPHASPIAAEQWRHDVDQLVVAAINTPPHRGRQANHLGGVPVPSVAHSRSLVALRVSSAIRAASLSTADLWAELERRRSSEDDCITIEPIGETVQPRRGLRCGEHHTYEASCSHPYIPGGI